MAHLVVAQLHDIILKKVFYIHDGVKVLPVLHSDILAYLKKLVLFDPVLAGSLIVPVVHSALAL
jgi:hypothetical protein